MRNWSCWRSSNRRRRRFADRRGRSASLEHPRELTRPGLRLRRGKRRRRSRRRDRYSPPSHARQMVEAAGRQRHAVPFHLRQNPLSQAYHARQKFRHDKWHPFVHAGLDQLGNAPVFQSLDLSEKLLGSLRLSTGEDVYQNRLARCNFPRGVRPDAVVAQQFDRLIEWTEAHVHPPPRSNSPPYDDTGTVAVQFF